MDRLPWQGCHLAQDGSFVTSSELDDLRREILSKVSDFERLRSDSQNFVPGESVIRYAGRVFGAEELQLATDAVLDFWLTSGRFTEEFESRLADYLDATDALMVNSGSSANLLAVATLTSPKLGDRRLQPGHEVITVAAGFPTTVAPMTLYGLTPVFVDVDLGGYNALPERVADAVGPNTRAIMLAHTMGNPWDADTLLDVARAHNLWVIEDNCDALGSLWNGRRTGGLGHLATHSFYPAHHLTTGEGGALVTKDAELARIAQSIRDWGRDCYCAGGENNTCGRRFNQQFGTLPYGYDHKYVYSHVGYNLKATDIQAAIGCAQFNRLDGFVEARRRNHAFLMRELSRWEDRLILPRATPGSDPSWFGFVLTVRENAGFTRAELLSYLEARRIETRNVFSGNLLRHPGFAEIPHRVVGGLQNSDRVTTDSFFIGVYPGLGERQLSYMAETFDLFFAGR